MRGWVERAERLIWFFLALPGGDPPAAALHRALPAAHRRRLPAQVSPLPQQLSTPSHTRDRAGQLLLPWEAPGNPQWAEGLRGNKWDCFSGECFFN